MGFRRTKTQRFVWMGFRRTKIQRFVRVCEILRIGKRSTKVRLASEIKIRSSVWVNFSGLLKNEKELKFELWGFLSLFPLTFPLFFQRVDQRLGIEINSFALPGSNCFGFLIPDDRIDYYSETTFNIRSFQDAIM
ncbi:unnamed protein product [Rhizophagus irregularis]|nr:unnamed protein product [Rhizophagus irregularis]CAB5362958.1 unnamed protein product [Rhizophagus irregularis]